MAYSGVVYQDDRSLKMSEFFLQKVHHRNWSQSLASGLLGKNFVFKCPMNEDSMESDVLKNDGCFSDDF